MLKEPRKVLSDHSNRMVQGRPSLTSPKMTRDEEKFQQDDLLEKIKKDNPERLLRDLAEIVHHSDSPLDALIDDATTLLGPVFYEGDYVKLKGSDYIYQIIRHSKRSGLFKLRSADGVELPKEFEEANLIKTKLRGAQYFQVLIGKIANHAGKYWIVSDKLCKELAVKNKVHPLMLRNPITTSQPNHKEVKKKAPNTQKFLSDTSDAESASSVLTGPVTAKTKEQLLNAQSLEKGSVIKSKVESDPSKKETKNEKIEKKQKRLKSVDSETRKKKEMKSSFFNPSTSEVKTSSPFLSPEQRIERKQESMISRLHKEFEKGNKDTFLSLATEAGKLLTKEQIESIDEGLINYFVQRAFDKHNFHKNISQLSPSKKAFETEVHAKTEKEHWKDDYSNKKLLTNHFFEKSQREDLLVCASDLDLDLKPVSDQTSFSNILTLSQAFFSLEGCLQHKNSISAERLFDSMKQGFAGFTSGLGIILHSLLGALQHGDLFTLHHYIGQRLEHFTMDQLAISEICRCLLIGERRYTPNKDGDETEVKPLFDRQLQDDLLTRFTPEIELWDLSVDDQVILALSIMQKVFDSDLYDDYINDSTSKKVKREQIEEENMKLSSLKEELLQNPDESHLLEDLRSRAETRRIEENLLRRNRLERQIAKLQESIKLHNEELKEDISNRKAAHRNTPLGLDRHFHPYYFFGIKSPNRGVWIHDFGACQEEVLIKEIRDAQDPHQNDQKLNEKALVETWFCLRQSEDVIQASKKLNTVGTREKLLKEALLEKHLLLKEQEDYQKSLQDIRDKDLVAPSTSFTSSQEFMKDLLESFSKELFENRLTALKDSAVFQAQIKSAENLVTLKGLLQELVKSIDAKSISLTLKGVFASSHFSMDKWLRYLDDTYTYSGLAMLLDFVHARIDWGSSIHFKRCKKCGRNQNSEDKLLCHNCGSCYHNYCINAKIQMLPQETWTCVSCQPKDELKKSIKKRRAIIESSEDEEIISVPRTRAKINDTRRKAYRSEDLEAIRRLHEQIKEKRIYASLATVTVPRSTRRESQKFLSLHDIEKMIEDDAFVNMTDFINQLKSLLKIARSQIADRKHDQIDDVEVMLNEAVI